MKTILCLSFWHRERDCLHTNMIEMKIWSLNLGYIDFFSASSAKAVNKIWKHEVLLYLCMMYNIHKVFQDE